MGITKERWNELSEKAQWDIKVALRGPDSYYGETLKWFTTSVIRGAVRDVFRVGGTVNSKLNLVILPYQTHSYEANRKAWNAGHFIEHITLAAEWIGIPILYVPEKLWHEVMGSGMGNREAAKAILLAAKEAKANAKDDKYTFKSMGWGSVSKLNELQRHYISDLGGSKECLD